MESVNSTQVLQVREPSITFTLWIGEIRTTTPIHQKPFTPFEPAMLGLSHSAKISLCPDKSIMPVKAGFYSIQSPNYRMRIFSQDCFRTAERAQHSHQDQHRIGNDGMQVVPI